MALPSELANHGSAITQNALIGMWISGCNNHYFTGKLTCLLLLDVRPLWSSPFRCKTCFKLRRPVLFRRIFHLVFYFSSEGFTFTLIFAIFYFWQIFDFPVCFTCTTFVGVNHAAHVRSTIFCSPPIWSAHQDKQLLPRHHMSYMPQEGCAGGTAFLHAPSTFECKPRLTVTSDNFIVAIKKMPQINSFKNMCFKPNKVQAVKSFLSTPIFNCKPRRTGAQYNFFVNYEIGRHIKGNNFCEDTICPTCLRKAGHRCNFSEFCRKCTLSPPLRCTQIF